MALKPQFIERNNSGDKSTRFYELRDEGIQYVQELSGHLWTNFNAHDPGLILLETLVFALTELGYKSNFAIADILQSLPKKKFKFQDNALYSKEEIFTTHPITLSDYRKLLIDRLTPEINNVWLERVTNSEDQFTGQYQIWLLADDEIEMDASDAIQKTLQLMSAHRNLCEQVYEVRFLDRRIAQISADIELSDEANPNEVLAAFFYHVEEVFLNPTFKRYTEEELLAKGVTVEEIYNGPKTLQGHFDASQLGEFPKTIEVEELVQILFQIDEGVLKVNSFKVYMNGEEYNEVIPLGDFLPLFLAYDLGHNIRCFQKGKHLQTDTNQIQKLIQKRKQGQNRSYEIQLHKKDQVQPEGKPRNIASMLPVEYDLPVVFGLGDQTLAKNATREEELQRVQLRSYLNIMNRFLENASRKLAHTASFFSIYENIFTSLSQQLYEELSVGDLQKRISVLDHLLARFGVNLPIYTEGTKDSEQLIQEIRMKEVCLQHIPELTANRSSAADLRSKQWGTQNRATVTKWLQLILGNSDFQVKSLTQPVLKLEAVLRKKNRFISQISMEAVLQKGTHSENYSIVKNRKYYVVWLTLPNQKIYLGKRKSSDKAEKVVETYCRVIRKVNTQSKGVFLLEDFQIQKNASFSVSLFFPAWISEMYSTRFRAFLKLQAIELLPAHIHAKFYALPFEQMQEFELFYQQLETKVSRKHPNFFEEYKPYQF